MQRIKYCVNWGAAVFLLLAGVSVAGPVSYTGGTYQQNFDSLASASEGSTPAWADGTTLPGWYGLLYDDIVPTAYTVTEGAANYENLVVGVGSIGGGETNPDSDRALGTMTFSSTTKFVRVGAAFTNDTGSAITGLTISYDGEQWRYRTTTPGTQVQDDLTVEYQIFAAGTGGLSAAGGWTALPALTFLAPHYPPSGGTRYDGNAPANRVAGLTASVAGISWGAGQELWIRWSDNGPDRAMMAVDNFSLEQSGGGGGGGGPISYTGGTYEQDFDSLGVAGEGSTPAWTDGTTLPGWFGLLYSDTVPTTYSVTSGAANYENNIVGVGSIGGGETNPDSDRALGTMTFSSTTSFVRIGAAFTNDTGSAITALTISYDGEQWRYKTTTGSPTPDDLTVEYQIFNAGAGALSAAGGWTALPALTFLAPNFPNSGGIRYDGNDPANRVAGLTTTVSGISWGVGQELWIRWGDNGPDRAIMAVDNFSLTLPRGVILKLY